MPEAICCYSQTCIFVIIMLMIELCIQIFVNIALTNCELHWHVQCAHYNVLPIIMYCLGCCTVNNIVYKQKKYDIAHAVIDMYISTKFHGFISFGFWVMLLWFKKKMKMMMMNKTPYHSPIHLYLTLGTHAQRGLRYLVRESVCPSLHTSSCTTGYQAA